MPDEVVATSFSLGLGADEEDKPTTIREECWWRRLDEAVAGVQESTVWEARDAARNESSFITPKWGLPQPTTTNSRARTWFVDECNVSSWWRKQLHPSTYVTVSRGVSRSRMMTFLGCYWSLWIGFYFLLGLLLRVHTLQ